MIFLSDRIDPASIHIPEDLPPVSPAHVEHVARSIRDLGQLAPIAVTPDNVLVFGQARLRACLKLGEPVWAVLFDNATAAKAAVARADADLTVAGVPEIQVAVHTTAHERWLVETGQRAGPGRSGVTTADLAKRIQKTVTATSRYLRIGRNLSREVQLRLLRSPDAPSWSVPTLLRLAALPAEQQAELAEQVDARPLKTMLDEVAPVVAKAKSRAQLLATLRKRLAQAEADAAALEGMPGMELVVERLRATILAVDAVVAANEEADAEEAAAEPEATVEPEPAPAPEPEEAAAPEPTEEPEPTPAEPRDVPPLARALREAIDTISRARAEGPPPPSDRRRWTGPAAPFVVPLGRPLGLEVREDGTRAEARGPRDALDLLDRLMRAVPEHHDPSLRRALREAVDRSPDLR